jgi:hypothetical protein
MATAFVATITVRNKLNQVTTIPLVGDDVTAHALTFPDTSSVNKLSSVDCWITDFVFPSTSVTKCIIYINGIDQGWRIINSQSLGTTVVRQVNNSAPLFIPAGSNVSFYQLT